MPALIFDIETGPLDETELKRMMPEFDPVSVKVSDPGEFEPGNVKLGNIKDEAKIAEKIDQARMAHDQKRAEIEGKVEKAREEHEQKFVDRAALSPLTGHVVAIGYQQSGGESIIEDLMEQDALKTFWARYKWAKQYGVSMIGWNIFNFDLPFLIRRSWFHGVTVPRVLKQNGRYWDDTFIDLMQRWGCGAYNQFERLDNAARFFGHDGKNGDGADFHRLWKEDRPTAVAYLENDLEMTELVATSMGFC